MFSNRGLRSSHPLLLVPAFMLLAACSSSQENGLFGDAKVDVCPPGCAGSLKADDSQIAIKIMNPTIAMIAGEQRADISGECYGSTYATNKILVSVLDSSNNVFNNVSYVNISEAGGAPTCVNGRFNIAVDFTNVTTSGTFMVQAKIIAYDAAGTQHTNSSDGISYVTVQRP